MTILDYRGNGKRVVAVIDGLRETETQLLHHVMGELGYKSSRAKDIDNSVTFEISMTVCSESNPNAIIAFGRNAHNAVWNVFRGNRNDVHYLTHPYKIRDKRFKGACPPPTMQYENWKQSIGRAVK